MFSLSCFWRWVLTRRQVPKGRTPFRPALEQLEGRVVPSAANQAFVGGLYQHILDQPFDPVGGPSWVQRLDNGMLSRFQVTLSFETSLRGATIQVEAAYQQYLHRAADPVGLNTYVPLLTNGVDLKVVDVILTSSNEFFTVQGDGTNQGFIQAIYADALGRSAAGEPGAQVRIDALNNQQTSLPQAALSILSSLEYQQVVVNADYEQLLGRTSAGDPGAEAWAQQLASGQ